MIINKVSGAGNFFKRGILKLSLYKLDFFDLTFQIFDLRATQIPGGPGRKPAAVKGCFNFRKFVAGSRPLNRSIEHGEIFYPIALEGYFVSGILFCHSDPIILLYLVFSTPCLFQIPEQGKIATTPGKCRDLRER
jgi:hypothetical protein